MMEDIGDSSMSRTLDSSNLNVIWTCLQCIVPMLALIAFQGPYSLRVYIASQHVSLPRVSVPSDKVKNMIALLITLAAFATMIWLAMILRPDNGIFLNVLASFLSAGYATITIPVFVTAFGIERIVIIRTADGLPGFHSVSDGILPKILEMVVAAGCFALSFMALIFKNDYCAIILFIALLHAFAQVRTLKVVFLKYYIVAISIELALVAFTYALILAIPRKTKTPSDDNQGHQSWAKPFSDIAIIGFYNAIVWAAICQSFVAVCYRFDYANYQRSERLAQSMDQTITHVTPMPSSTGLRPTITGQAIFLPRNTPKFPAPYYKAALAGFLLANVIFSILLITGVNQLSDRGSLPFLVYAMECGIWVPPAMLGAVVGLAFLKGDLQTMWNYSEQWAVIPQLFTTVFTDEGAPLLDSESLNDDIEVYRGAL